MPRSRPARKFGIEARDPRPAVSEIEGRRCETQTQLQHMHTDYTAAPICGETGPIRAMRNGGGATLSEEALIGYTAQMQPRSIAVISFVGIGPRKRRKRRKRKRQGKGMSRKEGDLAMSMG